MTGWNPTQKPLPPAPSMVYCFLVASSQVGCLMLPFNPCFMFQNIKYFGIDHLEFEFVKPLFEFNKSIDFDNSNFAYVDLEINGEICHFEYRSFQPQGFWLSYQFSLSVHDRPVPCFAIMYGTTVGSITSKSKIVIYSWFFVITQNGMVSFSIREFLSNYFQPQTFYRIKRLDIALDLALPLPEIKAYFDKIEKFHAWIWIDKTYPDCHQTYYTNDTQRTRNRYKLVRIYDKILDSFSKKKTWLFPHLHTSEEIRRVELELRVKACEPLKYQLFDLLEEDWVKLWNLFRSHMTSYSTFFHKHDDLQNLHAVRYSLDSREIKDYFLKHHHLPTDYVKVFLGYARKIVDAIGEKEFLQLLRENKVLHTACLMKRSTRKKRMVQDVSHIFHNP